MVDTNYFALDQPNYDIETKITIYFYKIKYIYIFQHYWDTLKGGPRTANWQTARKWQTTSTQMPPIDTLHFTYVVIVTVFL